MLAEIPAGFALVKVYANGDAIIECAHAIRTAVEISSLGNTVGRCAACGYDGGREQEWHPVKRLVRLAPEARKAQSRLF